MHASTTAQWITAASAIVALLGAFVTILDNRRTARQRLAYEYVARLEDPELIEHQATMSSFLRGGLQPPDISDDDWTDMDPAARRDTACDTWKHLVESPTVDDRETLLRILVYPNMLEGLAGMYNHGLLDRAIIKTHVESEARDFWEAAGWWLDEMRSEPESNTFRDIEVMMEDLAKRRRPGWYHQES